MSIRKIKNYQKINFADFQYLKPKRQDLAVPGIFAIFCDTTKKAYFESSSNILQEMDCEQDDLLNNLFQGPKELIQDVNTYEWTSFWFLIIKVGAEWKSIPKCLKEIEFQKEIWPYSLY